MRTLASLLAVGAALGSACAFVPAPLAPAAAQVFSH